MSPIFPIYISDPHQGPQSHLQLGQNCLQLVGGVADPPVRVPGPSLLPLPTSLLPLLGENISNQLL